jgi:hypothetical protein
MTEGHTHQTEANRQTIREAFESWENGTDSITEVFTPEMVRRIEDTRPLESVRRDRALGRPGDRERRGRVRQQLRLVSEDARQQGRRRDRLLRVRALG